MRTISNLIITILATVWAFIIINLVYGSTQYWWMNNYISLLNQKDRNQSISQIDLKQPKTLLDLFYVEVQVDENGQMIIQNDKKEETLETETDDESTNTQNPYDPEFEEEFESFFEGE